MKWFKKIKKNRIVSLFLKYTAYGLARALFATYRLNVTYHPSFKEPLNNHHGIFYFWHQHTVSGMFFFFKNKSSGSCVVSPSYDGQIAGFICNKLDFNVIYGSAHQTPISLIKSCLHALTTTRQLCLIGDGSRGPAKQLQKGITYLSKKAQVPLIFVDCKPSRKITFKKSWDHFQLPLPFSTISVHINAPVMQEIDTLIKQEEACSSQYNS